MGQLLWFGLPYDTCCIRYLQLNKARPEDINKHMLKVSVPLFVAAHHVLACMFLFVDISIVSDCCDIYRWRYSYVHSSA